jgi:alkylation response protein AidB-like acyl-CoA dehydrogenase
MALVCAVRGVDEELLEPLELPTVVHYCGHTAGPEGSGMKLRGSRTFRDYTNLALRLLGPDALIETEPWHTLFLTAPSLSIRGGTDEIQRNIVGERVLGLPEEPRVDRELPFDQLPR